MKTSFAEHMLFFNALINQEEKGTDNYKKLCKAKYEFIQKY